MNQDPQTDYGGARGSNTGDAYHELWAVRQALRMLEPSSDLTAVKVEGVPAIRGSDNTWDVVDCTLLFGGEDLEGTDRVELQQLRYSAATPNKKWTVARVCRGKNGRAHTSLIRRFGNAFKALTNKRKGRPLNSIKFSLVTNQPVSTELTRIFTDVRTVNLATFTRSLKAADSDLHRVYSASGLSYTEFKQFAETVDFQGVTGSRFAMEDEVLGVIAAWTDTEFRETANSLRKYIRNLMLPERAGELITKQNILIRIGVSDEWALFPCRPEIELVERPVSRGAIQNLVDRISGGAQRICLHGTAGVGKSTALQQIAALLPSGSEMITFDCYGGGSYLDAGKRRHRPRDAFVQLSNDLAQRLRLPAMFVPKPSQDFARAFRKRLKFAATALQKSHPKGRLVISIDAADNSITAARSQTPPESAFVTELMSFAELPSNVSLVISARTGRLDELNPSSHFEKIELLPFSQQETAQNVARYWDAPQVWIEEFHHLSSGVPRVQTYAFKKAGQVPSDALSALRPIGKSLNQIFDEQFQMALNKSGRTALIEKVCAGLIVLPRPIPVSELSYVLSLSESEIVDICADLAPGVRNELGVISLSDEDFEAFLRERAGSTIQEIQRVAAKRFLENARKDEYASLNVVSLLFLAGRGGDLLDFVESEPEPRATLIQDPIRRREIHDLRLLTAIRACCKAGNISRALRFVLIGAEAMRTKHATRQLLTEFPKLTVKFARETASRIILSDPNHITDHGPLISHSLSEDAIMSDAVGVREGRQRLNAWFKARRDDYQSQVQNHKFGEPWPFSPEDASSILFATAMLDGADAAIANFRRFSPFRPAIETAKEFVDGLLVAGRFELAEEIASKIPPWQAVFFLVPLARAGRGIDLHRLASGLASLKKRFSLGPSTLGQPGQNSAIGTHVIDTVLSAAEILTGHGVHFRISMAILDPYLDSDIRRIKERYDFEVPLLDAILRSYCLNKALQGESVKPSDVLISSPKPKGEPSKGTDGYEIHKKHRLKEMITAITPIYMKRAQVIVGAINRNHTNIDLDVLKHPFGHDTWRLDGNYNSSRIRAKFGEALTVLVAVGANPRDVMEHALSCGRGVWPEGDGGCEELWKRLTTIRVLHDDLLREITKAVNATRRERIGAIEKSRTLAAYAILLITISQQDAAVVFQNAVEVASELDSEAIDQIRLLDNLIKLGKCEFSEDSRAYARLVAEIVNDTAIRLQKGEAFPWRESISAIAHLDIPTALAGVARWDDDQIGHLRITLLPAIDIGLRTKFLTSTQAAVLLSLHDRIPSELLRSVLEHAIDEGGTVASDLAEEFARDILTDRIPWHNELARLILKWGKGEWTSLITQYSMLRSASPGEGNTTTASPSIPSTYKSNIIDAHDWDTRNLTNPDRLLREANQILARVRAGGGYCSLATVLGSAIEAVPAGARPGYLDALVTILANQNHSEIVDLILSAVRTWTSQLAVDNWCKTSLPALLTEHLPSLAEYLPWEDERLTSTIELSGLVGREVQAALLEGLERHVDTFGAAKVFALAGVIASRLPPNDIAELCKWYIERLARRIPEKYREATDDRDLPVEASQVVSRLLYAYMSDIDLRNRWRAAHALRRLARLRDGKTLTETVAQYNRQEESLFRSGNAPFYWLSARLWLMIGLDRISAETPEVTMPHGGTLLEICLSHAFPHILIRDYAADACRKLIASGHLRPNAEQLKKLAHVNNGVPSTKPVETERAGSFDSYYRNDNVRRFHFDGFDTLPYWYDRWLSVFEDLSPDAFLNAAEEWILDTWGISDEPAFRLQEPRPQRFPEESFPLSNHSHGSIPMLERYRTHLEWHAMWCTAGQLLGTHPVRATDDDDYNSLPYGISTGKLTHPPRWLSDFVGPVPLQPHRWQPTNESIDDWLKGIDDKAFLREIYPVDRPGWILVSADIDAKYHDRDETVRIETGLVAPQTAHALVRALQTADNNMNFYICPERHPLEIKRRHFLLRGWLSHPERDLRYDDNDPYRNGVGLLQGLPGDSVTKALGLKQRYRRGCVMWLRERNETPSFTYEAWGSREKDVVPSWTHQATVEYSGRRLLVAKDDLAEFLNTKGHDLIVDITITRRERRKSGYSHDSEEPRRAVFNRILLLRQSGTVEAAERGFAAWRSDCS